MFNTEVTIIGNVLTPPEWRRTAVTGTFVVTFKVASTSRRYDKERGAWVDGDSLRVKVVCWRKLGENVSMSIQLGDPVIVHGRLYTRDWTDEEGQRHTSYEVDAMAVGHDLSRGVGKFARRRPPGATDVVDEENAPATARGEQTQPVVRPRPSGQQSDDEMFDDFEPALVDAGSSATPDVAEDPASPDPAASSSDSSGPVTPELPERAEIPA